MATVGDVLAKASDELSPVVGKAAVSEALMLLAFVTGRQTQSLRMSLEDIVEHGDCVAFNRVINQRIQHQPISQIIGKRDFWKHEFIVTPDVLDPRPDTETLIEQALMLGPCDRVLDLGTGSGCILLSLLDEWANAQGVGVDASNAALDVARRNADALRLDARAQFQKGNWCDGLTQRFDLVVSNPPYITADAMQDLSRDVLDWEPRMALTPEGDGLEAYRQIIKGLGAVMKPKATVLFEIGFDQAISVSEILENAGFYDVFVTQDINGKDRVVQARANRAK